MKRTLQNSYLIIFLLLSISANGQLDSVRTSIVNKILPKEVGDRKWKQLIQLDPYRSFYRDQPIKVNGFRIGVQYLGVYRFGLGFYRLDRRVIFKSVKIDLPNSTDTSEVIFKAEYMTLFVERVLYRSKRWEYSLPIDFQYGKLGGYYEDINSNFLELPNQVFVGMSFGFQTKFFIFPWLAPRVAVGQRILFNPNEEIKKSFNKPNYTVGLQIIPGELIRSYKKWNSSRS